MKYALKKNKKTKYGLSLAQGCKYEVLSEDKTQNSVLIDLWD